MPHRIARRHVAERSKSVPSRKRTCFNIAVCVKCCSDRVRSASNRNVLRLLITMCKSLKHLGSCALRSDRNVLRLLVTMCKSLKSNPGGEGMFFARFHTASNAWILHDSVWCSTHGSCASPVICFRLPWSTVQKDHFSSSLSTLHCNQSCKLQQIDNGASFLP